jgi:ABC-2 type transport system permease protein
LTNIDENAIFKSFDVAVVGAEDSQVAQVMNQVELNNEKMFRLKFVREDEAKQLLKDKDVEGIVTVTPDSAGGADHITLGVNADGYNQLLLKSLLDNYHQKAVMIEGAIRENPDILSNGLLGRLDFSQDNLKHEPVSKKSNNTVLISFYSAIAMTCLYGAFISTNSIETLQANQKAAGQRLSVSPYRKSKMLGVDFVICFLLILLCVIIMMVYMRYALRIEFSDQFGGILFISAIGSLVSTAFGYFISLLLKRKSDAKIGIIVSITMLWSALAGMMAPAIKYYIEKHVPYLNYINPVALITDSFTGLYYYGNLSRAYPNILVLLVLFVLLMGFSVMKLRGQRYESL